MEGDLPDISLMNSLNDYSDDLVQALVLVRVLANTLDQSPELSKKLTKTSNIAHLFKTFSAIIANYNHNYALALENNLAHIRVLVSDLDIALDLNRLEAYSLKQLFFKKQKVVNISNYLKGTVWIVKCLNSGATVSAKVREHILAGLFRPEGA